MLFYLSLLDEEQQREFTSWAQAHFAKQRAVFRDRFAPVVSGLGAVLAGNRFDDDGRHRTSGGRRFLGWSVGRHWLLPAAGSAERPS
jgi:hypothetical protein